MRKLYYIITVMLFLSTVCLQAQNKYTKKADKYFSQLKYVKAADKYEDIVSDGHADDYVYKQLADSYYNLYNTVEAEKYYKTYLNTAENPEAEAYFNYAQVLKANGNFDESNSAMDQFSSLMPNDERAISYKENKNYINDLLDYTPRFTVEELEGLNTELSDFGMYEFGDNVYFVSARNQSRKDYGWNKQPTLDVYVSKKMQDSIFEPELLKGDVNSKYHEGTVSITPDGETMYFTRNDYTDGDYEKDSLGVGQLKIYKATLINDKWDDVQSLPFNNSEYSTGHTALSPDGKTLYFSSDMPGGSGMSDLYKVSINEDGTYGTPVNLGSSINTPGKESFPFIDSEGTLYFSSNGQLGLGGLDVFYAKAEGDAFGKVKNLGQPINSAGDDFAYTFNLDAKEGYLSSNRSGVTENVANDNLYKVVQIIPLNELLVAVEVTDEETAKVIEGAEVVIYNTDTEEEIEKSITTEDGMVNFTLPEGVAYDVQVNAEGYESNSEAIAASEVGELNLEIALTPIKEIVPQNIDLNPIYFEFDKSDITAEAAFELDKLVDVLTKYPNMDILVESHTDIRGSNSYNQKLSERRAKATVDYLIEKGVSADRISSNGLGETKPKVDCADSCTEEDHQTNRRSEFTLALKID